MQKSLEFIDPTNIFRSVSRVFSNPLRIKILNYIHDNPDTRHAEIWRCQTKLNRGHFAYHLRWLLETQLIKQDKKTFLYSLTFLGFDCIDFIKRIEQREAGASVLDEKGMFRPVRDSTQFVSFLKNALKWYEENHKEDGR